MSGIDRIGQGCGRDPRHGAVRRELGALHHPLRLAGQRRRAVVEEQFGAANRRLGEAWASVRPLPRPRSTCSRPSASLGVRRSRSGGSLTIGGVVFDTFNEGNASTLAVTNGTGIYNNTTLTIWPPLR